MGFFDDDYKMPAPSKPLGETDAELTDEAVNAARERMQTPENFTVDDANLLIKKAKQDIVDKLQETGLDESIKMKCPNCDKLLSTPFCPDCGKKTEPSVKIKCSCCGYMPDLSGKLEKFCRECGRKFDADDVDFNYGNMTPAV